MCEKELRTHVLKNWVSLREPPQFFRPFALRFLFAHSGCAFFFFVFSLLKFMRLGGLGKKQRTQWAVKWGLSLQPLV